MQRRTIHSSFTKKANLKLKSGLPVGASTLKGLASTEGIPYSAKLAPGKDELGTSSSHLRQTLDEVGTRWSHLRQTLDHPVPRWSHLRRTLDHLGTRSSHLRQTLDKLGIRWSHLCQTLDQLGTRWSYLRRTLDHPGTRWSHLRQTLDHPGTRWSHLCRTSTESGLDLSFPAQSIKKAAINTALATLASARTWFRSASASDFANHSVPDATRLASLYATHVSPLTPSPMQ
jgi:hypothetical protein